MTDMPWRDAIENVLRDNPDPMHYVDIARAILDGGYRTDVGATPAASVASVLSNALRSRRRSPFVKVDRGVYALRERIASTHGSVEAEDQAERDAEQMGLINAFGMFWERDQVDWDNRPIQLLGIEHVGSKPVDFASQAGVYLLYDVHRPVYVGRVTEQRLGMRLAEHTRGRLKGRWNRFSWFGVRRTLPSGELTEMPRTGISISALIVTMEALLIEGLEPPQNRRQGDGFNAIEFIQHTMH